jgi:hypothetical protein
MVLKLYCSVMKDITMLRMQSFQIIGFLHIKLKLFQMNKFVGILLSYYRSNSILRNDFDSEYLSFFLNLCRFYCCFVPNESRISSSWAKRTVSSSSNNSFSFLLMGHLFLLIIIWSIISELQKVYSQIVSLTHYEQAPLGGLFLEGTGTFLRFLFFHAMILSFLIDPLILSFTITFSTGSLVLDRIHRKAYCALSQRTHFHTAKIWCEK